MQHQKDNIFRNKTITLYFLIISLIISVVILPWVISFTDSNNDYGINIHITVPEIPGHTAPENGLNIIFFGYLNCGTVCPEQLLNMLHLQHSMKNDPIRFTFITLAPDMDSDAELERVMSSLGNKFNYYRPDSVLAAQNLALSYTDIAARDRVDNRTEIKHKGALFVVSPANTLIRIYIPEHSDPEKIKADLIHLISQRNNMDK